MRRRPTLNSQSSILVWAGSPPPWTRQTRPVATFPWRSNPDTGYPAISYYDESLGDLRYAAWNGTSWNRTTIDSAGNVGQYTSLAFDPADGNPAISYYDQTNGDLKLAWFNGTSWQIQPVDTVGTVGVTTSLAFNPFGNGFPAIVYGDNANNLYFIEDPPASVPEPQSALLIVLAA